MVGFWAWRFWVRAGAQRVAPCNRTVLSPARELQIALSDVLGANLDALARSKPHYKRNLAPLGLNLALQAALQVQLGAYWVDFWCSCNPQNRALASTRAQFSWFTHFCSPSALGLPFRSSAVGLGRLLDSTWRLLGVSWAVLGRSSAGLGRSWHTLGRSWEALGALLGALGRLLGVYWAPTWRPWGQLGRSLG